ncbi:MAG TPA: VOC family protein [Candidatus Baltobacteraceae bacterium]|nr:VOC family protein [Candidatus Baltobacteraceae bacterium]
MGNPVVHFEIMTKGAAALRDFYAGAFDWRPESSPGASGVDYATIHNDAGIDGGIGEVPDGYDGHVTFYVGVPDIAATLERIEKLGGTRMMGPEAVPNGPTIALFRDPHNHTVGLVQIT